MFQHNRFSVVNARSTGRPVRPISPLRIDLSCCAIYFESKDVDRRRDVGAWNHLAWCVETEFASLTLCLTESAPGGASYRLRFPKSRSRALRSEICRTAVLVSSYWSRCAGPKGGSDGRGSSISTEAAFTQTFSAKECGRRSFNFAQGDGVAGGGVNAGCAGICSACDDSPVAG